MAQTLTAGIPSDGFFRSRSTASLGVDEPGIFFRLGNTIYNVNPKDLRSRIPKQRSGENIQAYRQRLADAGTLFPSGKEESEFLSRTEREILGLSEQQFRNLPLVSIEEIKAFPGEKPNFVQLGEHQVSSIASRVPKGQPQIRQVSHTNYNAPTGGFATSVGTQREAVRSAGSGRVVTPQRATSAGLMRSPDSQGAAFGVPATNFFITDENGVTKGFDVASLAPGVRVTPEGLDFSQTQFPNQTAIVQAGFNELLRLTGKTREEIESLPEFRGSVSNAGGSFFDSFLTNEEAVEAFRTQSPGTFGTFPEQVNTSGLAQNVFNQNRGGDGGLTSVDPPEPRHQILNLVEMAKYKPSEFERLPTGEVLLLPGVTPKPGTTKIYNPGGITGTTPNVGGGTPNVGGGTNIDPNVNSSVDMSGWTEAMKQTYQAYVDYIDVLKEQEKIVNPNVEITPEMTQEFINQAETELALITVAIGI